MRIHFHMADESKEDVCTAQRCIPHRKFSMVLQEQVRSGSGSGPGSGAAMLVTSVLQCVCSNCGASSEAPPFSQMVHYISTTSLW